MELQLPQLRRPEARNYPGHGEDAILNRHHCGFPRLGADQRVA